MKAPKYFLLLDKPFIKQASRGSGFGVCLLDVHHTVNSCFNFILFVVSNLKFQVFFWLW